MNIKKYLEGKIIKRKWRILYKLRDENNGEVYLVFNKDDKKMFEMKIEVADQN